MFLSLLYATSCSQQELYTLKFRQNLYYSFKSFLKPLYALIRCCKGDLARLNKALIKVVNKVLLSGLQFVGRLLAKGAIAKGVFFIQLNLNLIVVRLVRREYIRYCLREYVLKFLVLVEQFLFYQLFIYKLTFPTKLVIGQSFLVFNNLINFI